MALWSTPVREYMSHKLISAEARTPLEEARALLVERDVSGLVVLDQGKLVGILSTTDLLRGTMIGSHAKVAADLMTTDVATIEETASLREAAKVMLARRTNRVVVLRKGEPVGVHSTRDAMRAVMFHHIEAPLARVMQTMIVTVDASESCQTAIDRLDLENKSGLVVVDGARPVGAFTHTEALKARLAGPEALLAPVDTMMSYETICLEETTPLYRAAGHAVQMGLRRIFVTRGGELVGTVTGFDLVRVMTWDTL
ncbi:MAG TPA: CBS domain-containing protein [Polyangiaceae bacterium]|jgi:CBS domain-containing protein|nr:CBS domain-containing protein [Polyangiaceae bacterium]